MHLTTRQKKVIWILTGSLLLGSLLLCKGMGLFNILDRVASPNGRILTTVYAGSREHFFLDSSITIRDTGMARGRTVYENARFIGLWWSPNSRYRLEAIRREGAQELWLLDFKTNICYNQVNALNRATQFLPGWEGARDIEYTFQGWDVYDNGMHFSYSFQNAQGEVCDGDFWYDRDEDVILQTE